MGMNMTRMASYEGSSEGTTPFVGLLRDASIRKSRGSGDESDKDCGLETHFRYVEREKELMKKNKS